MLDELFKGKLSFIIQEFDNCLKLYNFRYVNIMPFLLLLKSTFITHYVRANVPIFMINQQALPMNCVCNDNYKLQHRIYIYQITYNHVADIYTVLSHCVF